MMGTEYDTDATITLTLTLTPIRPNQPFYVLYGEVIFVSFAVHLCCIAHFFFFLSNLRSNRQLEVPLLSLIHI